MVIHAFTVCINYSDYLLHTLTNAKHFDSWTVITVPSDTETINVCLKNNIPLHLTEIFSEQSFSSAYTKGEVINEALEKTNPSDWIVLVDADTLLPNEFRRRIEKLDLSKRSLYGLYGRKDCMNWRQYQAAKDHEPWDEYVGFSNGIMGYMQLFHSSQPNNRYVKEDGITEMHDDMAFQKRFKQTQRKFLPLSSLHIAPPGTDWHSRISGRFEREESEIQNCPVSPGFSDKKCIVLVGFTENCILSSYNPLGNFIIVDWFGITRKAFNDDLDKDNEERFKIFEEKNLKANYTIIPAETQAMVIAFDQSDHIALFFQLDFASASSLIQVFRHCEKRIFSLSGYYYGYPDWLDSTQAINLAFGRPLSNDDAGRWETEIRTAQLPYCISNSTEKRLLDKRDSTGILVRISSPNDIDSVIEIMKFTNLPIAALVHSIELESIVLTLEAFGISILRDAYLNDLKLEFSAEALNSLEATPFNQTIFIDLNHLPSVDVFEEVLVSNSGFSSIGNNFTLSTNEEKFIESIGRKVAKSEELPNLSCFRFDALSVFFLDWVHLSNFFQRNRINNSVSLAWTQLPKPILKSSPRQSTGDYSVPKITNGVSFSDAIDIYIFTTGLLPEDLANFAEFWSCFNTSVYLVDFQRNFTKNPLNVYQEVPANVHVNFSDLEDIFDRVQEQFSLNTNGRGVAMFFERSLPLPGAELFAYDFPKADFIAEYAESDNVVNGPVYLSPRFIEIIKSAHSNGQCSNANSLIDVLINIGNNNGLTLNHFRPGSLGWLRLDLPDEHLAL